jgi:hypothetical protein
VYGIPFKAMYVLIFDTVSESVSGSAIIGHGIGDGGGQWGGGVVVGTKMFGIPYNSNKFLIYDVAADLLADLKVACDITKLKLAAASVKLGAIEAQLDVAEDELNTANADRITAETMREGLENELSLTSANRAGIVNQCNATQADLDDKVLSAKADLVTTRTELATVETSLDTCMNKKQPPQAPATSSVVALAVVAALLVVAIAVLVVRNRHLARHAVVAAEQHEPHQHPQTLPMSANPLRVPQQPTHATLAAGAPTYATPAVGAKPRLDDGGYVYDTAVNKGGGGSSEPTDATYATPSHTEPRGEEVVYTQAKTDHAVIDSDASHSGRSRGKQLRGAQLVVNRHTEADVP